MIMENVLLVVLYVSLIIHIILIGISVWRVWRGENVIERLMGADLISTLTVCILLLIALFEKNSIFIEYSIKSIFCETERVYDLQVPFAFLAKGGAERNDLAESDIVPAVLNEHIHLKSLQFFAAALIDKRAYPMTFGQITFFS